jgi:hypothetical protein
MIEYMDFKNIIKLRLCSKQFNEFIINNLYWKNYLLNQNHTTPLKLFEQTWYFIII